MHLEDTCVGAAGAVIDATSMAARAGIAADWRFVCTAVVTVVVSIEVIAVPISLTVAGSYVIA
jgi:hypothetical protein